MPRPLVLALRIFHCCAILYFARTAAATEADSTPTIVPPKLLYSVAAPPLPQGTCPQVEVALILTIDSAGRVSQVDVSDPREPDLDEAAVMAARQFLFTPAQRDGRSVPARVRYAFRFVCDAPTSSDRQREEDGVKAAPPPVGPTPAVASLPSATSALTGGSATDSSATVEETEITVYGAPTEAQRLQRSAEAVTVVDLSKARQRSADMGEVLARGQGITLRRDGGLGSSTRLSLNGLSDNQVRLFLDGVPLDLAGYPLGIANVPVNLIERVEVFRGVVPLRFGADALGGAVNLVPIRRHGSHAGLSYQVGSFGTYRLTANGSHYHEASGLLLEASGFLDRAENNYPTQVSAPTASGQLQSITVKRPHDAYAARGLQLTAGVVERSWAKQLLLTGFLVDYDKELPGNLVMTVPYGEVRYAGRSHGATLRYDVDVVRSLTFSALLNAARREVTFTDNSAWIYDWQGRRTAPRRFSRGEIGTEPTDQVTWQDSIFGRFLLEWTPATGHALRLVTTPQLAFRSGKQHLERTLPGRDPLAARHHLSKVVTGLEYELNAFEEALQNLLFVKDYFYSAIGQLPEPGGSFRRQSLRTHTQGAGNALRVRLSPWLLAKASYEYTTRLPEADETFGDGVLVGANLELKPETSHNLNVGPRVELTHPAVGELSVDLNGFLRNSQDLIVLLGDDRSFQYRNVLAARALGVEGTFKYQLPNRLFGCEAALTAQDVRNKATSGPFATYEGDRIPNRPYLFGSWGAQLRFAGLPGTLDTLEPFYSGRYSHSFFRGWESQGLTQFKQTIGAQLTHSVGVSWSVQRAAARVVSTLQIDNLTDARVFDNYGAQRPGRAVYLKLTGEL